MSIIFNLNIYLEIPNVFYYTHKRVELPSQKPINITQSYLYKQLRHKTQLKRY